MGELSGVQWFVFGAADDFMSHPALHRLGMAERNWLYAARLVQFLDALKLYTDEGYHAWFTAQASRAVREVFRIEARAGPGLKIPAIEALMDRDCPY